MINTEVGGKAQVKQTLMVVLKICFADLLISKFATQSYVACDDDSKTHSLLLEKKAYEPKKAYKPQDSSMYVRINTIGGWED